jgi:Transglutaminase-like superfamily
MQTFHPGFQGPVNVYRTQLSDDPETAVVQTIQHMAAFARADSESPAFKQLAAQMRGSDLRDTCSRCWNWIRARVAFVSDRRLAEPIPDSGDVSEVLIRPVDLIRMQYAEGDCDDFAMLGAALGRALGLPVYFVTVAADPKAPDQFSHVYLEFAGIPFDASHGPYMGWEVQNRFGKRALWSVENGMPVMRRGGRGMGDLCPTGYGLDSSGAVCVPDTSTQTLSFPYVTNTPVATPAPASTGLSFLDVLLGKTVNSGLSILQSRYGVPPAGTVISTPQGTISTVAQVQGASGLLTYPGGVGSATIPWWVWVGVAGVALLAFKGK